MSHYRYCKTKARSNAQTETSKKLAYTIMAAYIMTAAISWVSWFLIKEIPEQLLNYTAVPFSITMTGYFTKACVENQWKIKPPTGTP